MKISLRAEDVGTVLAVTGAVDAHNFAVLKAGIAKLFRDGKNRIALNLEDATEIDGEILRELAILDVFARELSGKIVLVSSHEDLKASVRSFSRPPVIPIVSTVDQALEVFRRLSEGADEEGEGAAELKLKLEVKERELASVHQRLSALDPRAVTSLRTENAALKAKLKTLEEQVETLTRNDRVPAGTEGFLEQIHALEESVKRLSAAGSPK